MILKPVTITFLFFSLIIFMAACNDSKPTEKMALDKLNKAIPETKQNLYEFKNFKKLNGVAKELAGAKIYEMDFSADMIAKQDLRTFNNLAGRTDYVADTTAIADSIKWADYHKKFGGYNEPLGKKIEKGQVIETLKKTISFVKKENGWE